MNLKKVKAFVFLITLLFMICIPISMKAQKHEGFNFEGGIMSSDIQDKVSYYLTGRYSFWLNPYVALSLGGMVLHSSINHEFEYSKTENYLVDDNIVNLNFVGGVEFSTPTFKGFGMSANLDFMAEPIPFNAISVDKVQYSNQGEFIDKKSRNKFIFTHFNPSVNAQIGIFLDIKREDQRTFRLTIGSGISNYNPHNTYYHARVDKIKIRDYMHVSPNKPSYTFFVRITGI